MPHDLQMQKLQRSPKLIKYLTDADDLPGGGDLTIEEWLAYIHKLCQGKGGAVGPAMLLVEIEEELVWKPTLEVAEELWTLLDADNSGVVDRNEIVALAPIHFVQGCFMGHAVQISSAVGASYLSHTLRFPSRSPI